MDFYDLYHFIFETYAGIGILVAAGLVLSILVCAITEHHTRKKYADRPKSENDWSFFGSDDEEDNDEVSEEESG